MAPIEQDDECTVFDPTPWGAQQRVRPTGSAALRVSGPLQDNTGLAAVPALARARRMPKATQAPAPIVESVTSALASAIPTFSRPAARAATEEPTLANAVRPATVAAAVAASSVPAFAATFGMPVPSYVAAPRHPEPAFAAMAPAIAHAMPGYASPALVAQYATTLPVRKSRMMFPTRIALPVGALLAAFAMLIAYLAQPSGAPRPALGALAITGGELSRVAMPAIERPAPIETLTDDVAEPTLEAAAPVIEAPIATQPVERAAPRPIAKHRISRKAKGSSPAPTTRHSSKRPRKIVAVDATTPLGNLRPRRF